jgi:hypothetical protein
MITRHLAAEKIFSHLSHRISLSELVDWAELAMMDGDIAEEDVEVVSEVVARIGVADVQQFGLLWGECEELLRKLGYSLDLNLNKVA